MIEFNCKANKNHVTPVVMQPVVSVFFFIVHHLKKIWPESNEKLIEKKSRLNVAPHIDLCVCVCVCVCVCDIEFMRWM